MQGHRCPMPGVRALDLQGVGRSPTFRVKGPQSRRAGGTEEAGMPTEARPLPRTGDSENTQGQKLGNKLPRPDHHV